MFKELLVKVREVLTEEGNPKHYQIFRVYLNQTCSLLVFSTFVSLKSGTCVHCYSQTAKYNYANKKQDGRLAPAYLSPNYKYLDQLLQTVKNKTTVLILVFKEFLQTSI